MNDKCPLLATWPTTGVLLFSGQYEPIFALALTGITGSINALAQDAQAHLLFLTP